MSYRVELTEGAYGDLDRLTISLAERSPESADRFTARFYHALSRLESFPLACGIAYESRFYPEELRHLLFEIRKKAQLSGVVRRAGRCRQNPRRSGTRRETDPPRALE